jgi:hypothetical protein
MEMQRHVLRGLRAPLLSSRSFAERLPRCTHFPAPFVDAVRRHQAVLGCIPPDVVTVIHRTEPDDTAHVAELSKVGLEPNHSVRDLTKSAGVLKRIGKCALGFGARAVLLVGEVPLPSSVQ